jgi:deoxyguanosine kinase
MASPKLIAVEGPIGVGKTSLVKSLSEVFTARAILEQPSGNPFLKNFYQDRKRYAFQTQIFFLVSRFQQLSEITSRELFKQVTICDYVFQKDLLFAKLNLDEDDFAIYFKVYRELVDRIRLPDLVVYLRANTDVLLKRIRNRNADFEKNFPGEYLEELVKSYDDFFFNYRETPLLVVNTTNIDFVKNPEDLNMLVKEIATARGGIKHYNPISAKQFEGA